MDLRDERLWGWNPLYLRAHHVSVLSHWSWFPGSSCSLEATVMPLLLSLTTGLTCALLWTWQNKSQSLCFEQHSKAFGFNSLKAYFQSWATKKNRTIIKNLEIWGEKLAWKSQQCIVICIFTIDFSNNLNN